jgi:MerR family transcriptional regulator, light-induced transcriptional regulator
MYNADVASGGLVRIGELSRRVGVRAELLRAWESRYGLLQPTRSAGGFRLYAPADERRVRAMRGHLASGYSAAEAARLAVTETFDDAGDDVTPLELDGSARELAAALDAYDDTGANAVIDRLLAAYGTGTVLAGVVLPYLHDLGERWARGEASVAQEHFASHVLRGRLLGLARGWGRGTGPRALLACAPGELHDLGLLAFGLELRARGWRVSFLGSDTPLDALIDAAETLDPELVVVAAAARERLAAIVAPLRELGERWPLAIAGPAATATLATETGARLLEGDPIAEADRVAATA